MAALPESAATHFEGLRVRTKVWVEDATGTVLISDYRARLLEAIAERGSVAGAARDLELPYRTAWKKLQEMEAAAGAPLLESVSGGSDGGGTRLTGAARELLSLFRSARTATEPPTSLEEDASDRTFDDARTD